MISRFQLGQGKARCARISITAPVVLGILLNKPNTFSAYFQERIRQARRQYLQHVRCLDARYPGSTLEQELKSYGVDGALCVLVSGPFANLSEGFNHVVDLIAHEKAAACQLCADGLSLSLSDFAMQLLTAPLHRRLPGSAQIRLTGGLLG